MAKHPGKLDQYQDEQSVVSGHRPIDPQVVQQVVQEDIPLVEEEFPAPEVGTAGKFISAETLQKKVTTLKRISFVL